MHTIVNIILSLSKEELHCKIGFQLQKKNENLTTGCMP